MSADLATLLERVRKASGGSRELDCDVSVALRIGPDYSYLKNWAGEFVAKDGRVFAMELSGRSGPNWRPEPYSTSIDAAVALVERVLPGAEYEITTLYGAAKVELPLNFSAIPCDGAWREDGNVPLAIIAALLQAKIAEAALLSALDTGSGR